MEPILHLVLKKHQHRLIRSLQIQSIIDWIYSYPSKKTDYMIDRMTFYRSFCEKVKEGFVFTQIKKEKCRGFFWFSVTGGLIHHGGLNLCAFSSLRDITFFGNDFLNPLWSGFFLFTWGLGWQIRRIYTSMTPGKAGGVWNVVVVRAPKVAILCIFCIAAFGALGK